MIAGRQPQKLVQARQSAMANKRAGANTLSANMKVSGGVTSIV